MVVPIALAAAIPVDVDTAAQHLGEAIRFQTVTHQDPKDDDAAAWEAQRAWLQTTYSKFTDIAERHVYPDGMLIYTWKGSDPSLKPAILMAHQDVVPADPITMAEWKAGPFSGEIKDGAVWGRGTIDDKGSLIAIMEALESLAARGYAPRRTIMVVSGAHEEGDSGQLPATMQALAADGLRAEYVLDEGTWIYDDAVGPGRPAAVIGLAEKGWAMLRIDARAPGGHSSVPPQVTAIETLSQAILAVIHHPSPIEITGVSADMLQAIAPAAPLATRVALANLWLFRPLVAHALAGDAVLAAQFHTTIAPTLLEGSPKENVLPQDASAEINFRMAPGDTSAEVMARAKQSIGRLPIELSFAGYVNEATAVASQDTDAYRAMAALVADMEKIPAAPGLMAAGTDSRYLSPLTPNIYRFEFMRTPRSSTAMMHGLNENLTIANLQRMTEFFARFIATTTR